MGLAVVEGKGHLFDMFWDPDGKGWESLRRGYEWLLSSRCEVDVGVTNEE